MELPEGAAPAAPKPLVARVAVLDHDGVYWPPLEERRVETVKPGELVFGDLALKEVLPEGAIYVGGNCDLPGGKYKWGGNAFVPLPRGERKEAPEAPTLEQALFDFWLKLGVENLPTRTAAWCEWMKKTVDERDRNKGGR